MKKWYVVICFIALFSNSFAAKEDRPWYKDSFEKQESHIPADKIDQVKKHLDAIIDNFKGKTDLTMVLGAGDEKWDYTTRFPGYTFLVNLYQGIIKEKLTDTKELELKLEEGQSEPIIIPLSFNNESFFYLLKQFKNSFKIIAFDRAVAGHEEWEKKDIKMIFESLQTGGAFYLDLDCDTNRGSPSLDYRYILEPENWQAELAKEFGVSLNDKGEVISTKYQRPGLYRLQVRISFEEDDAKEYGISSDKFGRFRIRFPSTEALRDYTLNLLKEAGFEVKVYKKGSVSGYPPQKPIKHQDGHKLERKDFIEAKKTASMFTRIIQYIFGKKR